MSVLHFAPEPCLSHNIRRRRHIHYVDSDLNPAVAKHAMDITQLPFRDASFDLLICSHVLAHVRDDAAAISELVRVLRPGGTALIMTVLDRHCPETSADVSSTTAAHRLVRLGGPDRPHLYDPELIRLYGQDFTQRLERGGFRVRVIDYRQTLGAKITKRYCLGNGDRELIFRCETL